MVRHLGPSLEGLYEPQITFLSRIATHGFYCIFVFSQCSNVLSSLLTHTSSNHLLLFKPHQIQQGKLQLWLYVNILLHTQTHISQWLPILSSKKQAIWKDKSIFFFYHIYQLTNIQCLILCLFSCYYGKTHLEGKPVPSSLPRVSLWQLSILFPSLLTFPSLLDYSHQHYNIHLQPYRSGGRSPEFWRLRE